jgi:hypothetical protein
VLERDVRQHDHAVGRHDVGRVEPASQARLDHHRVQVGSRKRRERRSGQDLELGDTVVCGEIQRGGGIPDRCNGIGEPRLADRALIDLDPLPPADDVRRQVRADPSPLAAEAGRCKSGRRGLAVGADDLDRGCRAVGVVERSKQPHHALQAEPHPQDRKPLDVSRGGDVGHGW